MPFLVRLLALSTDLPKSPKSSFLIHVLTSCGFVPSSRLSYEWRRSGRACAERGTDCQPEQTLHSTIANYYLRPGPLEVQSVVAPSPLPFFTLPRYSLSDRLDSRENAEDKAAPFDDISAKATLVLEPPPTHLDEVAQSG